ncbi:hypothetical protein ACI79Z_17590 [Geodermatophilus sp. SYSU D00663]
MGLARTSLMTLFIVMAANLRLMQTFTARQAKTAAAGTTPARRPRRPRMHTLLRHELRARIAAQKALAAAGDDRAAAGAAARTAGPPGP